MGTWFWDSWFPVMWLRELGNVLPYVKLKSCSASAEMLVTVSNKHLLALCGRFNLRICLNQLIHDHNMIMIITCMCWHEHIALTIWNIVLWFLGHSPMAATCALTTVCTVRLFWHLILSVLLAALKSNPLDPDSCCIKYTGLHCPLFWC